MRRRQWPRTLPPFRELDPGLAAAERLLEVGEPALAAVLGALPDEQAAADRLNDALAGSGATPRLRRDGVRWRVVVLPEGAGPGQVAGAAMALAALVAADGWARVKRCAVPGCGRPFVDRTNGRTRHRCHVHTRKDRG